MNFARNLITSRVNNPIRIDKMSIQIACQYIAKALLKRFALKIDEQGISICFNAGIVINKERIESKPRRIGLETRIRFRHEKEIRGPITKFLPLNCGDSLPLQKVIFRLPPAIEIAMIDLRERSFFLPFRFHENVNGHALHNIEDVFVFAAIRRGFLLFGTAVQVENVNFVERVQ